MDSQVTLIDPSLQSLQGGRTIFSFDEDNMHNTSVRIQGGHQRLYTVQSTKDVSSTKVYRHHTETGTILIAHIERSNIMPDKITFGEGDVIPIGKFLKSNPFSNFPATWEAGGKQYVWNRNLVNQLTMFSKGNAIRPLAWFWKSQKQVVGPQIVTTPAYLEMEGEVLESMDYVFVTCIILEHKIRMVTKATGMTRR